MLGYMISSYPDVLCCSTSTQHLLNARSSLVPPWNLQKWRSRKLEEHPWGICVTISWWKSSFLFSSLNQCADSKKCPLGMYVGSMYGPWLYWNIHQKKSSGVSHVDLFDKMFKLSQAKKVVRHVVTITTSFPLFNFHPFSHNYENVDIFIGTRTSDASGCSFYLRTHLFSRVLGSAAWIEWKKERVWRVSKRHLWLGWVEFFPPWKTNSEFTPENRLWTRRFLLRNQHF